MIRVHLINFNGIRNKVVKFHDLISTTKPDVILGTESKLNGTIPSETIFPPNYHVVRRDRKCSGGGVFVATRTGSHISPLSVGYTADIELLWTLVSFPNKNRTLPLLFGVFYRPPNSPLWLLTRELRSSLSSLRHETDQSTPLYLGGDFNLPNICWKRFEFSDKCREKKSSYALLTLADKFGLTQLVKNPTRSDAMLDLLLTSNPKAEVNVIPGLSDHDIVQIDVPTS